MCIANLLTLLTFLVVWPVEVAQTQLPAYRAELVHLSPESLQVQRGSEQLDIALENLVTVRFPDNSPSPDQRQAPVRLTLRDGSRLSGSQFSSDGQDASLVLASGARVTIPTRQLLDAQFRDLEDEQKTQWSAIVQSRITADMVVLLRPDGILNKIEGIISGISPDAVSFEFSGQSIDVPLAKLAGLRFFASGSQPEAQLTAIVRDAVGNRWMASRLRSSPSGEGLSMSLRCGVQIELPLSQLQEIDFSSGSIQYLADLEPLRRESRSRFTLGIEIAGAETVFGPRRVPASKPSEVGSGPGLKFFGSGSATYRIPEGFSKLVGRVELAPDGNKFSPCRVQVWLENQVLWEKRLASTGMPESVALAIEGDKRLRLVVEAEADAPVGDVVLWHELRLVK